MTELLTAAGILAAVILACLIDHAHANWTERGER